MPGEAQRFVLGLVYQAGPDPLIKRGADGERDYFTEAELEKAAWGFLGTEMVVGAEHIDGTEGHAFVKESYIYRGPDWTMTDRLGNEVTIKKGDWLAGMVLDEIAWDFAERGLFNAFSAQGQAKRIRRASA